MVVGHGVVGFSGSRASGFGLQSLDRSSAEGLIRF